MRRAERDDSYVEFVTARRAALVRTAYLMCGDWHRAEDVVQQALIKLYGAWPRVVGSGSEDAYVRRILVNAHVDGWRWRARRPEVLASDQPDSASNRDGSPDDREALRTALLRLPKGERAVVVLRFWEDLSIEQVASDLGVTTGTVKSQTARGLAHLRAVLGDDSEAYEYPRSNR